MLLQTIKGMPRSQNSAGLCKAQNGTCKGCGHVQPTSSLMYKLPIRAGWLAGWLAGC
jgi:hypothetical protein